MNTENNSHQTPGLSPELNYLKELVLFRLDKHLGKNSKEPKFPELREWKWRKPFELFIEQNKEVHVFTRQELILLLIAIVPHIQPDLFDTAIESKLTDPRQSPTDFPHIGGVRGKNCRFFLPTGATVLFLLADDDIDDRLRVKEFFGAEHIFWGKKILWLEDMQSGEPSMHGRLIISPDYIDLLTRGAHTSPQFSISFPAKKIAPKQQREGQPPPAGFKDLVIPKELKDQINELRSWLTYNGDLMDKYKMKGKLRNGYRTLFYGPPGTGKTFTAQILGNELDKEVYKIDLSMVVSKYIGETEKNLEHLFARAEDKNWILFFDEADALFGKRTNVRDAHDKYANQEVSYLLQRIEDYNGLVILATNMKNNIDDAFVRRFNSILKFPFPDADQRAQIWRKSFPNDVLFGEDPVTDLVPDKYDPFCKIEWKVKEVDIPEAVKKYELSGGSIMNVVHYACIKAVERLEGIKKKFTIKSPRYAEAGINEEEDCIEQEPQLTIYLVDVLDGIKREMIKEGKPFSL